MTRPRILITLTIALTLLQIFSLRQVLNRPERLAQLLSLSPAIEVGAGLIWGVIFSGCVLKLVQGAPNALGYTWLAIGGFALYSLIRLMFFARADYDRERLPFLIVITLCISVYCFIESKIFTHHREKENGRKPQN